MAKNKASLIPVLKRLTKYIKPFAPYLAGAVIFAAAGVVFTLLAPVLVGDAIDYVIGENDVNFEAIAKILVRLAATIIAAALFQWLMALCTNIAVHRTVKAVRDDAYSKLNRVPLKFIDGNPHGDIINRVVNDTDQISDGLIQGITQFLTGVVAIVGTLCFMLSINPVITLVVVVLTPLSILAAGFIAKGTHKMFVNQTKLQGELGGFISEFVGGLKTVIAFGYQNRSVEKFKEINSRLYSCGVKAQFYSALANPTTRFVNGIVYAAVGVIGAISAISGNISVGQLSCFLTYANQYTKPFNEVTGVITQLQTAVSSAQRVFELIDAEDETPDPENAAVITHCGGRVDISHVSFSYRPEVKLIEDFNLNVKSSNRIAIVGPTGCGKTTFINLLMRFYDTDSGSISIDGVDIKAMSRNGLRSLYGMVLQETWLSNATIKENIAYGRPDATDDEIVAAAKKAHAHSFIMKMPKGYDTLIAENGQNISQGQKQLLCIARVMLVDPPMLILDEATSSIDTRTELKIQSAFEEMMQGRTSFVVAHRLSTIKTADVILVMRDGHIIEQGSHSDLLAKGGFYSELYQSQFAKAE